jgi:hypothetical protein
MNITKESNDYSLIHADRIGRRDGKDCALLDREMKNPYYQGTAEYDIYIDAWKEGNEEEYNTLLH